MEKEIVEAQENVKSSYENEFWGAEWMKGCERMFWFDIYM